MSRTFSNETRILACSGCGAPLEALVHGGTVSCRYCGATNLLAPRVERAALPAEPAAPISEAERLSRLASQVDAPASTPASLEGLLDEGGDIPAWKIDEAVSVWQSARVEVAEVGGYEAAERLLALTILLAGHYAHRGEPLRQRAMFESALEVFQLPRHVQIVRGHLARCAVSAGELDAADRWLAPCDPRSDDLQTDSAYRLSRALIDTARDDAAAVLTVLGAPGAEVPALVEHAVALGLLRAHALEASGDHGGAVSQLRATMGRGSRRDLADTRSHLLGGGLCPGCFPVATQQHREAAATAAMRSANTSTARFMIALGALMGLIAAVLMVIGVVCLLLALISLVVPLFFGGSEGAWVAGGTVAFSLAVTGASLMAPGVGMLPFAILPVWIGRRMLSRARKAASLLRRGIDAQAELISIDPTGITVNDVPRYRLLLRITLEGRAPHDSPLETQIPAHEAERLGRGSLLPVVVDPDDPTRFVLDA